MVLFLPLCAYANAEPSRQRLTSVSAAVTMGQLAGAVQMLGAFNNLHIAWEEPARSMLHVLDALTFELDHLKIQCVFSQDDPVVIFSFTLLLFPILMVLLAVGLSAGKLFGGSGLTFNNYFNAVGLVATMIFLAITILALRPLHCIENPNGSSSMASKSAVVCWDSREHNWLVVLSMLAILVYPCTILATVVQITIRYARLVVSGYVDSNGRFCRHFYQVHLYVYIYIYLVSLSLYIYEYIWSLYIRMWSIYTHHHHVSRP